MKTFLRPLILAAVAFLLAAADCRAFFDPSVGKWASRDPIGEQGGKNVFSFVGNDPIQHFDALGLCSCECNKVTLSFRPSTSSGGFKWGIYPSSRGIPKIGNEITHTWDVTGDKKLCKYTFFERGSLWVWYKNGNRWIPKDPLFAPGRESEKAMDDANSSTDSMGSEIASPFFWKVQVNVTQRFKCTGTDGRSVSKTIILVGTSEVDYTVPNHPIVTSGNVIFIDLNP